MHNLVTLKVRPRAKSVRKDLQAFQTDVEPLDTIKGDELYKRLAEFSGKSVEDALQIKSQIEGLELFIINELRKGNRVDLGLVSFGPRLSGALPALDADPTQAGVFVRAAVKAKSKLSSSLDGYVEVKNDLTTETSLINNVFDLEGKKIDVLVIGNRWSVAGKDIEVDSSQKDEGVWLEARRHKRNSKPTPIAKGIIEKSSPTNMICRFTDVIRSGIYMLAIGTRGGRNSDFEAKIVRHQVKIGR